MAAGKNSMCDSLFYTFEDNWAFRVPLAVTWPRSMDQMKQLLPPSSKSHFVKLCNCKIRSSWRVNVKFVAVNHIPSKLLLETLSYTYAWNRFWSAPCCMSSQCFPIPLINSENAPHSIPTPIRFPKRYISFIQLAQLKSFWQRHCPVVTGAPLCGQWV